MKPKNYQVLNVQTIIYIFLFCNPFSFTNLYDFLRKYRRSGVFSASAAISLAEGDSTYTMQRKGQLRTLLVRMRAIRRFFAVAHPKAMAVPHLLILVALPTSITLIAAVKTSSKHATTTLRPLLLLASTLSTWFRTNFSDRFGFRCSLRFTTIYLFLLCWLWKECFDGITIRIIHACFMTKSTGRTHSLAVVATVVFCLQCSEGLCRGYY